MPEEATHPSPRARHDEAADEVVDAVLTASRLLVAVSARSLASVGETLTLPQFRMLVVLSGRGPMNISRLGAHLDVIPSTALRMVERLVAARMLAKESNPLNRREILISLTPEGRQVVEEATERRRAEIARIVGAMPGDQRTALIAALHAFNEAGDEPPAGVRAAADTLW
ncbi:MarR family transcriptional regulator [Streptomyces sp. NPDC047002]|uniref:MarR family winged helix-turn-helix transcriptional regulator n=1 Tax=Streptomyces sp. NPDC047002 TaxID=3155475 RepID=UPI00345421D4